MLRLFIFLIALLFFTSDNDAMVLIDKKFREFEVLVADGLEHLWDFDYLGKHPLSKLSIAKQHLPKDVHHPHVDLGRAVSQVLRAAIESLKPIAGQKNFSREKHYYTILFKAYVETAPNKTIAKSMHLSERTLYRYKIKAIQAVAQILRDWEAHSVSLA